MQKEFEKKFKAFLPYIIIIGLVYLIAPALLLVDSVFLSYVVMLAILPLTAGGCCAYYCIKNENDFYLCLVAPAFFVVTILLYGIYNSDSGVFKSLVYLVCYLLCGFLGLTIGDILTGYKRAPENDADKSEKKSRGSSRGAEERRPAARRTNRGVDPDTPIRRSRTAARPERVDVEGNAFVAEDPDKDESLDTATTSEDIDAILSEIHQRRGSE